MASYMIEQGTARGRGFERRTPPLEDGLLAKFSDWVVKTPENGGPGWYIIHDASNLPTDPFIVVSDQPNPAWDSTAKIMRFWKVDSDSGFDRIEYWCWWDKDATQGYGFWGATQQITSDLDFAYDFRGGEDTMIITTRVNVNYRTNGIDTWDGLENFMDSTDVRGTLYVDATDTGSSVNIYLTPGDEDNFTVNHRYFLYNFDGNNKIDSVVIEGITDNTVTVDNLSTTYPSGSVLTAYDHRYYSFGTWSYFTGTYWKRNLSDIPYTHVQNDEQNVYYIGAYTDKLASSLGKMNPNIYGYYGVMQPILYSQNEDSIYGIPRSIYLVNKTGLGFFTDGLVIDSIDWIATWQDNEIFGGGSSDLRVMIQDETTVS